MHVLVANTNRGFFGGVEQYIHDVATNLVAAGHTVDLVHGTTTAKLSPRFDEPFRRIFADEGLVDARRGAAGITRIIADSDPDLVYLHKVPAVRPFLDRGVPVVRMVHDHDVTCPRRHRYDLYTGRTCDRAPGPACFLDLGFVARDPGSPLGVTLKDPLAWFRDLADHRRLDGLIVASDYVRRTLVASGVPADRVEVIPPPIRRTPGVPRVPVEDRRLLYVGQLIRGKGVDLLLKAMEHLDEDVSLTLIGDGNARDALEAQARRGRARDRITFAGWVAPEALESHYAASRVVVVPSRWPEPYGLVGPEAMSQGRAVVAFDVGGIRDWLVDGVTGLLARSGDVPDLARHLGTALAPGVAERLGAAARERFRTHHSVGHAMSRLVATLDNHARAPRRETAMEVAA